jgi:hypothetical protein
MPPRQARYGLYAAAASLAAGLAVWSATEPPLLGELGTHGPPDNSSIRAKGGRTAALPVELQWVIRRAEEVFTPAAGASLHAGDGIRFRMRSNRPGYAAVLSLDGEGRTSVYQGWVPISTGTQLLPGAVELDGVLGDEHLYGLVCDVALPLQSFEDAIRRDPGKPEVPAGCVLDHHVVRKGGP